MSDSLKIWFFIGDLLLLNLCIVASLNFYGGAFWMQEGVNNIYLLVFSNLAWIFLVMVSAPYNVTKAWSLAKTVKSQLAFVFIHLLVVIALVLFFRQKYSFFEVGLIYLLFVPLFFVIRLITLYLRKVFATELSIRNYMLIGRNELSNDIRKFYLMNPDSGYKFQGYIDFEPGGFSVEKVREVCLEKEIQEIYCCVPDMSKNDMQMLINFGMDTLIKVKVIANPSASQQSVNLDAHDRMPGIDVTTIPLDATRNQVIKRIFDFIFSSFFCVFFMSWIIPIIALIIKLDSKGPVFFVQLRSGQNNKPFRCLKFRTMVVNADSDSKQASRTDARITKLGHFLRKTSIDELPQFINVFMGSMSVVGPRPHMLKHTDEYSKLIERFMGRHYVKPGITGLAQCLGYRGETKDLIDMENRVRMDRYYIENWTFWFDLKIIFLTVVSLIRGSDKAF
ncbi:MAG: exopolysaccharide biosynthesis polyprenyl glycosylphosphotransferase [Bacteroidota bacterium]